MFLARMEALSPLLCTSHGLGVTGASHNVSNEYFSGSCSITSSCEALAAHLDPFLCSNTVGPAAVG